MSTVTTLLWGVKKTSLGSKVRVRRGIARKLVRLRHATPLFRELTWCAIPQHQASGGDGFIIATPGRDVLAAVWELYFCVCRNADANWIPQRPCRARTSLCS